VQRALSARSMSAARRTPIIGAFPKALIPLVIVIPGMIAGVLVPQLTTLKQGGETDVTYNNALSLLMNEVLPNGILGVALAGLLASFMAGMAANVSSLNTVFTYDLWQDWIRPGLPDEYYLRVGRTVTVVGCLLAIGTAFIAGSFANLMDYIQALFSFFNAPLFAIFILGLFWKRMTGTAGWTGLIGGALAAIIIDVLVRGGTIAVSSQAGSFIGASAAFVVGVGVAAIVTTFTTPKPDAELVGLVWSLTSREDRGQVRATRAAPEVKAGVAAQPAPHAKALHRPAAIEEVPTAMHKDEGAWWQSPVVLGGIVLALTLVLYLMFV
jgi:SSS family solute:Na+ symporter